MKPKLYPEERGNGSAKNVELMRVQRIKKRQKESNDMSRKTHSKGKKTINPGTKPLDARVRQALLEREKRIGRASLKTELESLHRSRGEDPLCFNDMNQLKLALDCPSQNFTEAWTVRFEILAGLKSNTVYSEPPKAEPVEAEPKEPVNARNDIAQSNVSGIVRVVDGIPFSLPALDRSGAKQARVTLTDLSELLGYKDKQGLKRLAERNNAELLHYGMIDTVTVMLARGNGASVESSEPAYSPDQCIILGLASQTEVGRSIRVRMLDAYKSLLAMFEQVVATPQVQPAIDYQALAMVVGTAVASAMAPMIDRLSGLKQTQVEPSNVTIKPQVQPKPTVYERRESGGQERIKYGIDRRHELNNLVRGRSRGLQGREKGEFIRDSWHALYGKMLDDYDIDVNQGTTVERLNGRDINGLDWIAENGHLDTAIECAIRMFTKAA